MLLCSCQVPTFLPYGSMVSAVFISNWLTLPIVMFFLYFKMVEASELPQRREVDDDYIDSSNNQTSINSLHIPQGVEEEAATRRVRRAFLGGMLEVFILLTLTSVIGWLPYFAMDLILAHQGYSAYELQNINQVGQVYLSL